jgi:hypothetical protein
VSVIKRNGKIDMGMNIVDRDKGNPKDFTQHQPPTHHSQLPIIPSHSLTYTGESGGMSRLRG